MTMDRKKTQPAPTLGAQDFVFILFRHKWKIVLCTLLGLVAAGGVYFWKPPLYRSDAKLLIRYVINRADPTTMGGEDTISNPDTRADNLVNSEIEILASRDLINRVLSNDRITNLLHTINPHTGPNREDFLIKEADRIVKGMSISNPRRGNVIQVSVGHADKRVPREVLSVLIDEYIRQHNTIHRSVGSYDFLLQQEELRRNSLTNREVELKQLKKDAGIVSLQEARDSIAKQRAKIREDIMVAEAELASHEARLQQIEMWVNPAALALAGATNAPPGTNPVGATNAPLDSKVIREYKSLVERLDRARRQESELLSLFNEESDRVKDAQKRIAALEEQMSQLEQANPGLAAMGTPPPNTAGPQLMVLDEKAQVASLKAKIATLNNQFETINGQAAKLDEKEVVIAETERQKSIEETNYVYLAASLQRAKIDADLGLGKAPNISRIQEPTPPNLDLRSFFKPIVMAIAAGFFGGLGLALLLEFFLDQSIKRPGEITTRVRLPLYVSIPLMSKNGRPRPARKLKTKPKPAALPDGSATATVAAPPEVWETDRRFQPYCEGLRDRLVLYFQQNNLTHKPKLLGITSCSPNAGVSSIALGLAAALSETGDGNVLLVDVNSATSSAHPFHKGKPSCGLLDALEQEKRDHALVHQNLYRVAVNREEDGALPIRSKRFSELIPKLKASDYDYIIFDMPPISQTSVSFRLSGLLDKVLLVVEAEKVNRDAVQEAATLLEAANANVAAVFNKARHYGPRFLQQAL